MSLLWLQRVIAVVTVYTKYVLLYTNQFAAVLIGNNIVYDKKMLRQNAPTIKLSLCCPSVLLAHRGLTL
jgi:oligoribonuclease (3'-5' exoribonuclease)